MSSSASSAEEATSDEVVMLEKRIEEELTSMMHEITGSADANSETETAQLALFLAAREICYKRKYYDATKDEIVYFPTLVKSIMNHTLLEKADELYAMNDVGREELPRKYHMSLRKIAFSRMKEEKRDEDFNDDDSEQEEFDRKVMMRLSQPVGVIAVTSTASPSDGPTLMWKRGSVMDNEEISFPVQDDNFVENDATNMATTISEDQIQKNLSLRRQASFLRKASIMDSLDKYYEPDPMKKSTKVLAGKESEMRQTRIMEELKKMIEQMLPSVGETEMENEAHQAIAKAANDICYTRKYFDTKDDKMVYIPSLVKAITNDSLFEKAKEYYDYKKFPEKYSSGLRTVAFEQMKESGVSDFAEEEKDYAMKLQLSQPVGLTAPSASPRKKSRKMGAPPTALKDKRMESSEETLVWTRSTRFLDPETSVEVAMEKEAYMAAALSAVPEHVQGLPTATVRRTSEASVKSLPKKPAAIAAVSEETVQQKLGMRRQASFLRKAAVLDAISKNESEEDYLPPIGETAEKKKKAKAQPSKLVDKRMDTSEEAFVWTRSDRNLFGAEASIPFETPTIDEKQLLPTKKVPEAKKASATEEDVRQKLGMRRQASFLRKAAVLDAISKNEGEENVLPPIGEESGKKKTAKGRPSKLVDKRMDTSEEAFVWTRSDRNLGADARISFDATPAPEQQLPAKKEAPVKKPNVTEEDVQQKLGMRRQASFLRKAAVLDAIVKNEGEEDVLPPIGEEPGKKKTAKGRPSKLVDKRMDTSEEAFVWTRSDQNLGADTRISFDATPAPKQQVPAKKEAAAKKAGVTEEQVQQKLGVRRQESFVRKATVLDAIVKNEEIFDMTDKEGEGESQIIIDGGDLESFLKPSKGSGNDSASTGLDRRSQLQGFGDSLSSIKDLLSVGSINEDFALEDDYPQNATFGTPTNPNDPVNVQALIDSYFSKIESKRDSIGKDSGASTAEAAAAAIQALTEQDVKEVDDLNQVESYFNRIDSRTKLSGNGRRTVKSRRKKKGTSTDDLMDKFFAMKVNKKEGGSRSGSSKSLTKSGSSGKAFE